MSGLSVSIDAGSESATHPNWRLSRMLIAIGGGETTRIRISIGDLLAAFGDRAYRALNLVFAAPKAFPVVMPGVPANLGAPLLFRSALGLCYS